MQTNNEVIKSFKSKVLNEGLDTLKEAKVKCSKENRCNGKA